MNKAVVRIMQMKCAAALDSWRRNARLMKRVRLMVAEWRHRQTAAAFVTWSETTAYEVEERTHHAAEQSHHAEVDAVRTDLQRVEELMHTRVVTSSVQRMKLHRVMKAMNSWRSFLKRKTTSRNVMNKAVVRIQDSKGKKTRNGKPIT